MRWITLCSLSLLLAVSVTGRVLADEPAATPHADVVRDATAWLDGMDGKIHKATLRSADGVSPLPVTRINERQFAFTEGNLSSPSGPKRPGTTEATVYVGIGFTTPPTASSTKAKLQSTLNYLALNRVPVPGVTAHAWMVSLQTPSSSFRKGVTVESFTNGVLKLRVQTEFFAIYGHRTDVLVPADTGMPEGTYFQVRRPVKADLTIEGRLFPAP